jgi:PhnB protein
MSDYLDLEDALRALPSPTFRVRARDELERTIVATTSSIPTEPIGLYAARPYLIVGDADAAIAFYVNVFDAEEVERHLTPEGRVAHAKVRIGDTFVELGEHQDARGREAQALPAVGLRLYVPDVDATYERAVVAGAIGSAPPENRPYGSRDASIYDPFGLTWWLAGPMA